MARQRRFMPRLAAYAFAGLLLNWFVAAAILSYSRVPAMMGMTQVNAGDPIFDRALPPGVPRPDVAFRERGIGVTYWQFYAGDGLATSPFIAHMRHAGVPLRSWSILEHARNGPTIDLGIYREGYKVVAPSWLPEALRPPHWMFYPPLRPLPLGLIVNTLIYAALLALAVDGLAAVRRRFRARRSLCTLCKYPIRDLLTCPECGTAVVLPTSDSSHAGGE